MAKKKAKAPAKVKSKPGQNSKKAENSEGGSTPTPPTEPNWQELYEMEQSVNKAYEEQIKGLEGQVTELQSRLHEEEARSKSYEEQIKGLEGQVTELQSRLHEEEARNKGYEEQHATLEGHVTKLHQRLHEEEARSKSYEEQITKFQAETMKFQVEVAELLRHLNEEKRSTESEKMVKEEFGRRLKELKAEYDKLSRNREREKKKAASESAEHAKEKDELHIKIEELHVTHIKSVNNIGTGLEPITDQTFRERFVTLHANVQDWCRRTFAAKSEIRAIGKLDSDVAELLSIRVFSTEALSAVRLMESLFWGYAEERILSAWFPAMSPKNLQQMSILEENIRFGDNSGTYERADFWRAYTTSLLFQNEQVKSVLGTVDVPASELGKLFSKVQVPRRSVAEIPLRDLLHSIRRLAAQLRCQRGVYEVDDSICLGDRYDDERMVDLENPDLKDTDDVKHARVRAIVSKGVVWKSFTGPSAVVERICKARVLVVTCTGERNTKQAVAVTGKAEEHSKDIVAVTGEGEDSKIVVVPCKGKGDSKLI